MSRRIHAPEPPLRRPPFNIVAVDEARTLAARAERLHREADTIVVPFSLVGPPGHATVVHDLESPEAQRVAALRRVACDLDRQADDLVPVEYR